MNEEKPLDEYFLEAILTEPEIPEDKDASITSKLKVMSGLATPTTIMGEDYSVSYVVGYNEIKNKIMNEEEAYKIRTLGWKLDRDKQHLILTF